MGYTATERQLAEHFREGMRPGLIPGTGVTLTEGRFRSSVSYSCPEGNNVSEMFRFLFRSREAEERNREFSYYVMKPDDGYGPADGDEKKSPEEAVRSTGSLTVATVDNSISRSRGAILLLHGLNERNWGKYIQWGTALAVGTGRPVVLFPLAWHMNRSPRTWIDRHIMMPLVNARTSLLPDTRLTTFVNVALSTRMTVSPQRFMLSGYQTVKDLSEFIVSLRNGTADGIADGGSVDIFAYSIGALATQVMMLAEPSPLPPDSRVMLFCGGSTFGMMNGTSRLIMDSLAFEKLLSFYLGWPARTDRRNSDRFAALMNDTPEGRAFYAMTSLQRLTALRGRPFSELDGRLCAVSLAGDTVIPPEAVRETLNGADVKVWNPGYQCTHESPFPLLAGEKADAVDRTFGRVFETAARFLS